MIVDDETRRELDRMHHRIDLIDRDGSRGVVALQAQVTSLVASVADLRAGTLAWQKSHSEEHSKIVEARKSDVRWRLRLTFGGAAALAAVIGLLIAIISRVGG